MAKLTPNIFGMRIRRVTDLIAEQGREAFWRTGVGLDAKLTSIVIALHEEGRLSSSELAGITGFTRQLVEVRLKKLEKDGYVQSRTSRDDARKRVFSIAPAKRAEIARAASTMADFEQVYEALWREIGMDLGDGTLRLERALRTKPLLARLCDEFPRYKDRIRVHEHDE